MLTGEQEVTPPRAWLLYWTVALALGLVDRIIARKWAHHVLCAGFALDAVIEIEINDDLSGEEAVALMHEALERWGMSVIRKETVYWTIAAHHVRSAPETEPKWAVALSIPIIFSDYDYTNPIWQLKSLGEDVGDHHRVRGWLRKRVVHPDLFELERRLEEVRNWRTELPEEEERLLIMLAKKFDHFRFHAKDIWFDPRDSRAY